ncbi:unnamed protein product, partial [Mesorhabditis belari]|uniref:Uncharacterized protein n=1 Tax=Mesorhabditis belari TaxID=2138241 RepID=A0AAF3JB22_9BILA
MYSIVALATHILVSAHAVGDVRHISIPGDLILGGVFPVHWKAENKDGHDPCGSIAETSCEDQRNTLDSFTADDKVQYVIDAVYALAHALQIQTTSLCISISMSANVVLDCIMNLKPAIFL